MICHVQLNVELNKLVYMHKSLITSDANRHHEAFTRIDTPTSITPREPVPISCYHTFLETPEIVLSGEDSENSSTFLIPTNPLADGLYIQIVE